MDICGRDGRRFLSFEERVAQEECARQRAKAAERQAEPERQARKEAERCAEQLVERLRALGIDPET